MLVVVDVVEIREGIMTLHTVFDVPNCPQQIGKTQCQQGLQEKQKEIVESDPSKICQLLNYERECRVRGLCEKGYKKDLQIILKEHLDGIQRVPAMLVMDQGRSIKDLHLGM